MCRMCVCVHVFLCCIRADGVMRTMNTDKLIKTLPIIQNQLDALLDFQVTPHVCLRDNSNHWILIPSQCFSSLSLLQPNSNELTNGVINTAFMLLFKDSIRLFAAYNEGVINMLGKPHIYPEFIQSSSLFNTFWDPKTVTPFNLSLRGNTFFSQLKDSKNHPPLSFSNY